MVDQPAEQELQQFLQIFLRIRVDLVETDVFEFVDESLRVRVSVRSDLHIGFPPYIPLRLRSVLSCTLSVHSGSA